MKRKQPTDPSDQRLEHDIGMVLDLAMRPLTVAAIVAELAKHGTDADPAVVRFAATRLLMTGRIQASKVEGWPAYATREAAHPVGTRGAA